MAVSLGIPEVAGRDGMDVFVDPYNMRMEKDSEWKVVTMSAVFP